MAHATAPSFSAAPSESDAQLIAYLNLKLRELGLSGVANSAAADGLSPLVDHFLALSREKDRALARHLCPVDQRLQDFLDHRLASESPDGVPRLPATTLVLDRPGLARVLSLPPDADKHQSNILSSHRVRQGVLHNPRSDRRTTQGIFHIADFGIPVPDDKKAVPAGVFSRLLRHALNPPVDLLRLPFTSTAPQPAECFVSLHLRPVVCPAVPGFAPQRAMETRFFVPGALVANLDFVERIFGNAGDPHLPENDAGLDPEHWSGHTGCVILATHLNRITKREAGLPQWDAATPRQQRDGMCWKQPDELYNDGVAFKLSARDTRGVIVTLISDNYFGYCKKDVKAQISFAANLLGQCEEEHAGGAIVFPSYDLGEDFRLSKHLAIVDHTFSEALAQLGERAEPQPGGWARDRQYPDICYVPQDAFFDLRAQTITWGGDPTPPHSGEHPAATPPSPVKHTIKLVPRHTYVLPSGYKVEMVKPEDGRRWRLRGTTAEGVLCHKPCTVSGGGKSEISKSIADAIFTAPNFVSDLAADFAAIDAILKREYGQRFRDARRNKPKGRPLLSPERSLGSVVKLLSRSPDYTEEYNTWLGTIPRYILDLVLLIKRVHKPEWGADWRKHFTVDTINGRPGNELKFMGEKAMTHFLRVGFTPDGGWRTFSLRKDFHPALKIQAEDDITASTVVPIKKLTGLSMAVEKHASAVKFVHNCEAALFQRPDEAIHRGYDKRTERDFSRPGNFFSNYEPLTRETARGIVEDAIGFDAFTEPVRKLFEGFVAADHPDYLASPAHPRIVDGKPSKNPRYLQPRPDLEDPRTTYLAQVGAQLYRRVPPGASALFPVGAVLAGRRLNPPEPGVQPMCVFGPLHYQELPEAFMDFIASLTGKSPSTTGAGSEGALTKGPFNALPPIHDLNAAVVSYVLTDLAVFSSAAGWVGPRWRVDHDISLLVPEIWARMSPEERTPRYLIEHGYLERCIDWKFEGKPVLASRLGWRVTSRFVQTFCGRVLGNPSTLFDEELLRPELQDRAVFAAGMDNIVQAMRKAAECYFADGSVVHAVPPLHALLHIMRDGSWQGHAATAPEVRELFSRPQMLKSDWYMARLEAQQHHDIEHWEQRAEYLTCFLARPNYADVAARFGVPAKLAAAQASAATARGRNYIAKLTGTLGVDPALAPMPR